MRALSGAVLVLFCTLFCEYTHGTSQTEQALREKIAAMDIAQTQVALSLTQGMQQLEDFIYELESTVTQDEIKAGPKVTEIDRRQGLSYRSFYNDYALKSKPVIITDVAASFFAHGTPWTPESIFKNCPKATVSPRAFNADSTDFARLTPGKEILATKFVERYSKSSQYNRGQDKLYMHDWSIPLQCPNVMKDFIMPKYFSPDFLQIIKPDVDGEVLPPINAWPSLFIGPQGTQSAMHVDSFGSNFWMLLTEGTKEWNIFKPAQSVFLYEIRAQNIFNIDTFEPNVEQSRPLYARAEVQHCILKPGELLFVPSGSPHQVRNLEDTVAFAGNYVDGSNYNRAKNILGKEKSAGVYASEVLHDRLAALDVPKLMRRTPKDMSWRKFKSQRNAAKDEL